MLAEVDPAKCELREIDWAACGGRDGRHEPNVARAGTPCHFEWRATPRRDWAAAGIGSLTLPQDIATIFDRWTGPSKMADSRGQHTTRPELGERDDRGLGSSLVRAEQYDVGAPLDGLARGSRGRLQ